jgi:hypothetical protein
VDPPDAVAHQDPPDAVANANHAGAVAHAGHARGVTSPEHSAPEPSRGVTSRDLSGGVTSPDRSAPHSGPNVSPTIPPDSPISVTGVRMLDAALDRAVDIPSTAIHTHVDKLRARNPYASPAQIIALLEKEYIFAISASGGAVGAAAAAPAVVTGAATALTVGDIAAFFAASAAYSLAVADVFGIAVEETARRRTLLLATVLGEQGARTIGEQTGIGTATWAKTLLVNMPTTTIRKVNNALTRRLLRRQAAKHGALALGRLVPFGIGAAIGIAGARALGKTVIESAHTAFGPPPLSFPRTIEIVAAARDEHLLPTREQWPTRGGRRILGRRRDH